MFFFYKEMVYFLRLNIVFFYCDYYFIWYIKEYRILMLILIKEERYNLLGFVKFNIYYIELGIFRKS